MEKSWRLHSVRALLLAHRTHLYRAGALSPDEMQDLRTDDRGLKITEGVFSKLTDTLELYRVKDLETRQPFLHRLVGIENIEINTSDVSTPFVLVEAIPSSVGFGDKLRNQVEIIRTQKRVRELDVE
jgi:uncharacterized membrane protein YdbT with pleckstrin-like domain